ncbi:hypothetical protein [Microvirga roseola]|uniref:hypothetical protein n=1 Tax=Microvirga roseola TaxID=2883126 RepID=UPI001E41704E|nr:hypothetical protein [Microvirga roseola]
MDGIEIDAPDNRVKIESASLNGFSIAPTLKGLKALQGKPLKDLDHSALRSLIPTLGTLRLSGMGIDTLDRSGPAPERTNLTVKSFEITADKPVNGIPTNIRIDQQNSAFELPANSTDEFLRQLIALGYKTLDTSFVAAATWNEESGEIAIKELSLEGQEIGSVSLSGTIGSVGRDLFSTDKATAAAALIGAKAKALDIVVDDKGLLERYLAKAAEEQKTSLESLRRTYAGAAPLALSSLLGNSEQAKTLGQAVSRFIAQPGRLTISAEPKNPSGFGVMDFMLASDPKEALKKLDVTAKAE